MDHIFQQKLVRENQQLQLELAKVNKQIKQLQEKVFAYENVIAESMMPEKSSIKESHTLEQLKRFDKGKLNKLKIKYSKELSNIHSLLKKK
jgi:conjugal transfer/entry exclusion protein